ncbi:nacht and wd40 domain containing protein [Moelleriella libera RCEF 2490]|uniref:Nacht and wd40 domain containing protein n=1 Tax=Moelleriella libera RCEF 2490 TaxID=1081109 RepID=A0A168EKF9_9HYPO|nr:nacht and wd40 domain containing protein [Moelleriella libera RCEF 2490]
MLENSRPGRERVERMSEMSFMSLKEANRHAIVHSNVKYFVDFVATIEKFVEQALSTYPRASFARAGICAVLPLIANPSTQKLAMTEGLCHVMEKMGWYIAVPKVSFSQESLDPGLSELGDLVKNTIVKLFKKLLNHEIKCVSSCYDDVSFIRAAKSLFVDDWKGSVEKIKGLETEVDGQVRRFHGAVELTSSAEIWVHESHISVILDGIKALRNYRSEGTEIEIERQRWEEIIGKFSDESTRPHSERMDAIPKEVPGACD